MKVLEHTLDDNETEILVKYEIKTNNENKQHFVIKEIIADGELCIIEELSIEDEKIIYSKLDNKLIQHIQTEKKL